MFVHHVFFWLKEPASKEACLEFEKALAELVTIETIHSYNFGKPADTQRPVIENTYQYSLLVIFQNKADHDVYQEHPKHDIFRTINDRLSRRVLVYDSEDF